MEVPVKAELFKSSDYNRRLSHGATRSTPEPLATETTSSNDNINDRNRNQKMIFYSKLAFKKINNRKKKL